MESLRQALGTVYFALAEAAGGDNRRILSHGTIQGRLGLAGDRQTELKFEHAPKFRRPDLKLPTRTPKPSSSHHGSGHFFRMLPYHQHPPACELGDDGPEFKR